jgi:hypothetical protein
MEVISDPTFMTTLIQVLPHWLVNTIVIVGCLYKFCGNFTKLIFKIVEKSNLRRDKMERDRIEREKIKEEKDKIQDDKINKNSDDITEIKVVLEDIKDVLKENKVQRDRTEGKIDDIYDYLTKDKK